MYTERLLRNVEPAAEIKSSSILKNQVVTQKTKKKEEGGERRKEGGRRREENSVYGAQRLRLFGLLAGSSGLIFLLYSLAII